MSTPNIPLELHACMGLNACKGHDRLGTNDCAGTGAWVFAGMDCGDNACASTCSGTGASIDTDCGDSCDCDPC